MNFIIKHANLAGITGLIFAAVSAFFQLYLVTGAVLVITSPFIYLAVRNQNKRSNDIAKATLHTHMQLLEQLEEVQLLATVKLAGAPVDTQKAVAAMLIDAAKHLAEPYQNSAILYPEDYVLQWNKQGLALLKEARDLLEHQG
ncbi:MAG: hypothetical protein P4L53_04855 [Candidatus Obscuribacterales bacterium]|nr:hypothetical protein [Candidatus Obscuribacterales bacterium]